MRVSSSVRGNRELDDMVYAGFDSVMLDLGAFCLEHYFEKYGGEGTNLIQDKQRARFQSFWEHQDKVPVSFDVVRAPHLSWNTNRTDLNDLMFRIGKSSIETCARLHGKNIIIQPLFLGIGRSEEWKENHKYYFELGKIAYQNSVRILLENQCKNLNGRLARGVCTDMNVVSEWVDLLNNEFQDEAFGFCLDSGTCNLCRQDMGELATMLGSRLKAVLVRQCDDANDAGRLPVIGKKAANEGTNDWMNLICSLRKLEFEGTFIIDAGRTLMEFSHLLRSQLYPVVKSVADFFRWQIDIEKCLKKYPTRVLFGSGKMCRNYLRCYGEQYPPLFVCDNNPELWETKIFGIDIKSPEVLKEIPEDCAVIICNTFYEDIASQLIKMGVKNIEAFNDEYLPIR